jgi:hypothetical protein
MSWVIERVSLTTDFMSSVTDLISWVSEPQHVRTSYVTGKSPRLPVWRSCCGSGDPRSNGRVNREPHEPREPYIF